MNQKLIDAVSEWFDAGASFAVATVVEASGSAPLPLGAMMAVGPAGEVFGGVSGGCVDGAVYQSAIAARDSGTGSLESFEYSDEDAFAVALPCGGRLTVLVEPVSRTSFPQFLRVLGLRGRAGPGAWATAVHTREPRAVMRITTWGENSFEGSLGDPQLEAEIVAALALMRDAEAPPIRREAWADWAVVLRGTRQSRPRLLVFGASEHAVALTQLAVQLGFEVTVCDPRPVFATRERFPDAAEVVCEWPDRYLVKAEVDQSTAICLLTHDARFDVPLLLRALQTEAMYIGAMGSRRTCQQRQEGLLAAGTTAEQLARVHAPIGLDLGGRTPGETALSILAEIVAVRFGRTGDPLRALTNPLHGS